jgi:hypothetical protein
MKMRETDAPAFVAHFQRAVLDLMPARAVAILTVPQLTQAQRVDPSRNAPEHRVPIVNQIFVLGSPAGAARQRTVRSASAYLLSHQQHLLSVARDDLIALESWGQLVREGQVEFDARYRREFLTNERFHRFDEALVRLLELLELPGVGRFVSKTMDVLRLPWTMAKKLFTTVLARPQASSMPEQQVLEDALAGWTDQLRKEATRKAPIHPLWQHVHDGFNAGLGDSIKGRFHDSLKGFEIGLNDEVERTARAIYEDLEKNPVALNSFRGTKFVLEVAGIVASATAIIHGGAICALLIPLSASVVQMLVEFFGKQYVDFHREQTRDRQQALVVQHVSAPLAEWLTQWPTTGGSVHERLQCILQRLPANLQQLQEAVEGAIK